MPAATPFTLTSYMWHRAEASESNSSVGTTLSARTSTGSWSNWGAERVLHVPSTTTGTLRCSAPSLEFLGGGAFIGRVWEYVFAEAPRSARASRGDLQPQGRVLLPVFTRRATAFQRSLGGARSPLPRRRRSRSRESTGQGAFTPGATDSSRCEACSGSWSTVCRATSMRSAVSFDRPVFRLRA